MLLVKMENWFECILLKVAGIWKGITTMVSRQALAQDKVIRLLGLVKTRSNIKFSVVI